MTKRVCWLGESTALTIKSTKLSRALQPRDIGIQTLNQRGVWAPVDLGGGETRNVRQFKTNDRHIVYRTSFQQLLMPSKTNLKSRVFERRVFQNNGDGTESFGRIDCYKRGHFILEARQESDADRAAAAKTKLISTYLDKQRASG